MEKSLNAKEKSASGPLLVTKLTGPRLSRHTVSRPRLISLLDKALQPDRPLTLISAPAGFGKTSLLGEWVSHSAWQVAWVTLDEADNDPARFWAYFIGALQMLREGLGNNAQAAYGVQAQPVPSIEPFLTVLLNELAAISYPLVLVLDDYHLIDTPAIHTGLTFLIEHLPAQMHLIVTSRADPPLPLSRWRASGQMAEIRADDLRFTKEETSIFLTEVQRLPLLSGEVAALLDRTEGWIAGLQLVALSMQGRQDVAAFIAEFTGSHHFIVDYLTEEILQQQPELVQTFLLHTSILDRLCGPLCEAVTGQPGGQAMLEHLERANLFLQRLDDERHWFRYHQLFVEMLRNRLRQQQPDLILLLQQRASVWYEQNGLPVDAIRHALAGKDYERAADLIEANANDSFWRRSEIATMFVWLKALPDELVRRRPRLCQFYAWALLLSGQLEAVEPLLEDIEASLPETRQGGTNALEIRGQLAAIRARLARMHNNLPLSIDYCHLALEYLPTDDLYLRGVISLNLGLAYWQSGDIATAGHVLGETCLIHEPGSNLGTSLAAQEFLADLQAEQGHLHQAARTYQQAIERAAEAEKRPSPIAAWAYTGLGELMRQWNDLHTAGHSIEKGIELARQWGNADGLAWASLHLARWKETTGNTGGADKALLEAEQVVRLSRVAPWTAAEVSGYRGRLWIAHGLVTDAIAWAQEHGLQVENEISYLQLPEYLSLARLLIAQGRLIDAHILLERMLRLAENLGLGRRVIEILALQALALQSHEKTGQALSTLERTLALAEPEGCRRLFMDEGERMKALLQEYLRFGGQKSEAKMGTYAAGLLTLMTQADNGAGSNQPEVVVLEIPAERLSRRELEILRLLAEGLSNREIAQQLYISSGTVKVHLKHIFNKLKANNRTEAAAQARRLGLV
jgi:LuxR family transcriptional regulator, maltose regulon positive regulatory protein